MKIMFNEIGGKVVEDTHPYCNDCVFNHTKFCEGLDIDDPLFIPCKNYRFLKDNLDIFGL